MNNSNQIVLNIPRRPERFSSLLSSCRELTIAVAALGGLDPVGVFGGGAGEGPAGRGCRASIGGTATSTVIVCVEMEGKKAINYFGHGIVSTCSQRSLFCFSRS